jgi:hypothetical protein
MTSAFAAAGTAFPPRLRDPGVDPLPEDLPRELGEDGHHAGHRAARQGGHG